MTCRSHRAATATILLPQGSLTDLRYSFFVSLDPLSAARRLLNGRMRHARADRYPQRPFLQTLPGGMSVVRPSGAIFLHHRERHRRAHPPVGFFLSMSMTWLSLSWCGTDPSGVSLSISFGSMSARDFDVSCSPRLNFDASSLILSLPRASLILICRYGQILPGPDPRRNMIAKALFVEHLDQALDASRRLVVQHVQGIIQHARLAAGLLSVPRPPF